MSYVFTHQSCVFISRNPTLSVTCNVKNLAGVIFISGANFEGEKNCVSCFILNSQDDVKLLTHNTRSHLVTEQSMYLLL